MTHQQQHLARIEASPTDQPLRCRVLRAGQLPYLEAWAWQRELVRQRSSGSIDDTLLLLQHPHTYTLGRGTMPGHLLASEDELAEQGIMIVESDRGGDITYHGPGQVVGYPILKLSRYGGDVLRYLRMLEDALILALAEYGMHGSRISGLTGVWIEDRKIAAIGVKLSASGITQHGFALNLTTDLRYFSKIIPCGIADKGITSMAQELGSTPAHEQVEQQVAIAFGKIFGVALEFAYT